jgi:hypothetical protein
VKFWDASAVVPLLVMETTTPSLQTLARRDPDILVWWGSQVEGASALARLERGALLDAEAAALAFDRLKQLADGWHEIERTRSGFFAFIRCERPMRCNLQRRSLPPNTILRRSKSSRSTNVSPTLRGRKGSSWSILSRVEHHPVSRCAQMRCALAENVALRRLRLRGSRLEQPPILS